MNIVKFDSEEFKSTELYKDFIKDNPDYGYLKVQVFTADHAIPLEGVVIDITKKIGDNMVIFFEGVTNSSGIIDNIKLPSPKSMVNTNGSIPESVEYKIKSINEKYHITRDNDIRIYGGIKMIQNIKMTPNGVTSLEE